MIRLNVFMRVSADNRSALIATARHLTEMSLKEDGCVAYDIFESATRPDVLMICETWKDREALDAHCRTAHFKELSPRLHSLAEMKKERFDF